jgi:hypothetical protein
MATVMLKALGKYVAVVEIAVSKPGWHSPRKMHVYTQSVLNLFPSSI